MGKDRPDRWETELTEEQARMAFEWMQRLGVPKAAILINKEFGGVPAMSTLYRFYERMSEAQQIDDMKRAVLAKANIEKTAHELGNVSEAVASGLGQLALHAISSRDPDQIEVFVNQFTNMLSRTQADRKIAVDETALKLKLKEYEDRMAASKAKLEQATKAARAGGLSEDALREIEEAARIL